MNNNSKHRQNLANKEKAKGSQTSIFTIPRTMPGSTSLGTRTITISHIFQKSKDKFPKVARKYRNAVNTAQD